MSQSITIPTNLNCDKRIYTATLSGSAEVNGDHVATVYFPKYVTGLRKDPGDEEWTSLKEIETFHFTDANEQYQLKLWTGVVDETYEMKIPYTVQAVYAPAWAAIHDEIIATPLDDPCCFPIDPSPIGIGITCDANIGAVSEISAEYYGGEGNPNNGELVIIGVGFPEEPGTRAFRPTWTSIFFPNDTWHPQDPGTQQSLEEGSVIVTDTSGAANKPNNWAATAFDTTINLSTSRSHTAECGSGGCNGQATESISATMSASSAVRVWKEADSFIVRTQRISATASISSSTFCGSGIFNNSSSCTECPPNSTDTVEKELPCTNAKLVATATTSHYGGVNVHSRTFACVMTVALNIVYVAE